MAELAVVVVIPVVVVLLAAQALNRPSRVSRAVFWMGPPCVLVAALLGALMLPAGLVAGWLKMAVFSGVGMWLLAAARVAMVSQAPSGHSASDGSTAG